MSSDRHAADRAETETDRPQDQNVDIADHSTEDRVAQRDCTVAATDADSHTGQELVYMTALDPPGNSCWSAGGLRACHEDTAGTIHGVKRSMIVRFPVVRRSPTAGKHCKSYFPGCWASNDCRIVVDLAAGSHAGLHYQIPVNFRSCCS